jgi:hypothetical protein
MFNAIDVLADILPEGWEVLDESTMICPHGDLIEWDGHCPEGCASPLMGLGLI